MELCLGMDKGPALWTRTIGRTGKGDVITVGVCYGPADQEEQLDEALYRMAVSCSQVLVSLWGTSTTLIYAVGTTQQDMSNPGGSQNAPSQIPLPSDKGANKESCSAGLHTHQQGGAQK